MVPDILHFNKLSDKTNVASLQIILRVARGVPYTHNNIYVSAKDPILIIT